MKKPLPSLDYRIPNTNEGVNLDWSKDVVIIELFGENFRVSIEGGHEDIGRIAGNIRKAINRSKKLVK